MNAFFSIFFLSFFLSCELDSPWSPMEAYLHHRKKYIKVVSTFQNYELIPHNSDFWFIY